MWDPRTTLHPNHNLHIAEQYLQSLPTTSLSHLYSRGEKQFKNPTALYRIFSMPYFARELNNFYPFHPRVEQATQQYYDDVQHEMKTGIAISAISWFCIYQSAKRGKILPILNRYGRKLKTHRLFRQYVWSAVLPTTLLVAYAHIKNLDTIGTLWAVHARRMTQQMTSDPNGTRYPKELLPIRLISSWKTQQTDIRDIDKRISNEVDLVDAPDYENPEFEAVDLPEAEEQGEGDDQDGGDEQEEDD